LKRAFFVLMLCASVAFPTQVRAEAAPRRSLLVTVLQAPQVLSSREEISGLIDFSKKAGITRLYVQVYRANQSWFPSKVADPAPYEACLKNVSEDPFALLIKKANAENIEVYAWLNLLSLSQNKEAPLLKKYGNSILTRNLKVKKRLEDYLIDEQYFLEPGDPRVRKELSAMVGELVSAYPALDGVLFDYIRYPDKNPRYGYTEANIKRFAKATGSVSIKETDPAWQEWKRSQVTELLKELAAKARSIRPGIRVATTGCAPYARAYYEAFQDWQSWLSRGLIDGVTAMTYSQDIAAFKRYVLDAKRRSADFAKVDIAVGAYNLTDSPQKFIREFEFCKEAGASSCVIFHYGSILKEPSISGFLTATAKQTK